MVEKVPRHTPVLRGFENIERLLYPRDPQSSVLDNSMPPLISYSSLQDHSPFQYSETNFTISLWVLATTANPQGFVFVHRCI